MPGGGTYLDRGLELALGFRDIVGGPICIVGGPVDIVGGPENQRVEKSILEHFRRVFYMGIYQDSEQTPGPAGPSDLMNF